MPRRVQLVEVGALLLWVEQLVLGHADDVASEFASSFGPFRQRQEGGGAPHDILIVVLCGSSRRGDGDDGHERPPG